MTVAPWPAKETLRLAKLQSYDILDTPPEPAYDDVATLAAHICKTPIALVSLIDSDRQWFKARVGMDVAETPRDLAFCSHTIQQSGVLIVEDTHQSPLFCDNPLVTGPPYIRFYAGAPLVTPDGHALGTVCVIDYQPHHLDEQQLQALQALSRQAIAQLELDYHAKQLKAANTYLEQRVQERTLGLTSALHRLLKTQSTLIKREAALRHSSLYDPLTGLPNRSYFLQRLDQAIQLTTRQPSHLYAVLFLDLNNFKPVNDTLGHEVGDLLLQHVAEQIQLLLRKSDLVARLGGDEFAVLLDGIPDQAHAISAVKRLQTQLSQPCHLADRVVFIDASIGVTFSSVGYRKPELALRDANIAMYQAKKRSQKQMKTQLKGQLRGQLKGQDAKTDRQFRGAGQPRSPILIQDEVPLNQSFAVFDAVMQRQTVAKTTLEDELRQALLEDQFHLYYQPIFDLMADPVNSRLTGCEVLMRWHHPTRGCLEAQEFIEVAEEIGIVRQLGAMTTVTVCEQLQAWRRQPSNQELRLHINLSLQQIRNPHCVTRWKASLAKFELPASAFNLEIEEHVLLSSDPTITQVLSQLTALGFGLWVDDFGRGHSSLSRLHQFNVSGLKIDRAFVKALTSPEEDSDGDASNGDASEASSLDIVKTIVDLGNSADITLIAEGIETRQQLDTLVALGCQFGQGFWLSEALTANMISQQLMMETERLET